MKAEHVPTLWNRRPNGAATRLPGKHLGTFEVGTLLVEKAKGTATAKGDIGEEAHSRTVDRTRVRLRSKLRADSRACVGGGNAKFTTSHRAIRTVLDDAGGHEMKYLENVHVS